MVADEPNLLYETVAVAPPVPTWREPTVKRLLAEAVPWTSKRVSGEVVPMPTLPSPVIFWLLPVIAPPRVKALIVRVPVELEIVSVLRADDSSVLETEALEPNQELPETEAVPPTSSVVSINPPALIPNLEAELPSSKLPDTEALPRTSRVVAGTVVPIPTLPEEPPGETQRVLDNEAGPAKLKLPMPSRSLERKRSPAVEIQLVWEVAPVPNRE